jgi:hypothetical protein
LFNFLLAITCIIPATIGLLLYQKIDKKLYPFIYTILLAVVTELIAVVCIHLHFESAYNINYNVFSLLNLYFFVKLFIKYQVVDIKWHYPIMLTTLFLYIIELLIYKQFQVIMRASMISSLFIVIGCINILGRNIFVFKSPLYRNTQFILFISTIILYLFDIFNSAIGWVVPLPEAIQEKIALIFRLINAASYLLISYGLLCLYPKKN